MPQEWTAEEEQEISGAVCTCPDSDAIVFLFFVFLLTWISAGIVLALAHIVAFLLRLEVFNSLLKSCFGGASGSAWPLNPHYLLLFTLLATDASPSSGQKKKKFRLSNFSALCMLLCLFHDGDIAALTS